MTTPKESPARRAANKAVNALTDRKSFCHWWDNVDEETQQDIVSCIEVEISAEFKSEMDEAREIISNIGTCECGDMDKYRQAKAWLKRNK